MMITRSLLVWYGWNATPSSGLPSASLCSLISMPSGLFEPTSCSAMMCTTTSSTSISGTAITWNAKKRFSVMSEMKKSPRIHSDRSLPMTGIAPNSDTITCAPQYDMLPHGSR